MVKKYNNISRKEFLYRFFDLYNFLQFEDHRLTKKEIRFVIEVMSLPEKFKYDRFSTKARNYLRTKLASEDWVLSVQGISQLIQSLEKKEVIILDSDNIRQINPILEPFFNKKKRDYFFTFAFNLKKDEL